METKTLDLKPGNDARPVRLEESVITVCRNFYGSFDEIPSFLEEVKSHLAESDINFDEEKFIIVFNDLKKNLNRDNLKIYAGMLIENKADEKHPYFIYQLNRGRYLHSEIPSVSFEDVKPAVENLLEKKNFNGSTNASTAILISDYNSSDGTCHLYMKLKDSIL